MPTATIENSSAKRFHVAHRDLSEPRLFCLHLHHLLGGAAAIAVGLGDVGKPGRPDTIGLACRLSDIAVHRGLPCRPVRRQEDISDRRHPGRLQCADVRVFRRRLHFRAPLLRIDRALFRGFVYAGLDARCGTFRTSGTRPGDGMVSGGGLARLWRIAAAERNPDAARGLAWRIHRHRVRTRRCDADLLLDAPHDAQRCPLARQPVHRHLRPARGLAKQAGHAPDLGLRIPCVGTAGLMGVAAGIPCGVDRAEGDRGDAGGRFRRPVHGAHLHYQHERQHLWRRAVGPLGTHHGPSCWGHA